MSTSRCSPFWAESPSILYEEAMDFYPFSDRARRCTTVALNSFTRFGIYLGILLSVIYRNGSYLGLALGIAAVAVAAFYGIKDRGALREGYENIIVTPTLVQRGPAPFPNIVGGVDVANKTIADVIGVSERTQPTAKNPFMNLLVNEIKDNPLKAPAASVDTPQMARALSDEFQTRIYGDPSDVFQHTQNQRTWIVQPSSSVPNDRDSFQNWLFRVPGRTCKEGNLSVCRSGTEGGAVTWLNSG